MKTKMKIKKSLLKRFKITKNGKVFRRHTGQDHLGSKKSGDRLRHRKGWVPLSKSDYKRVKKVLGL